MRKLKSLELAFDILGLLPKGEVFLSIFLSNLKKKTQKMEILESFSFEIKGNCSNLRGLFLLKIAEIVSLMKSLKIIKIDLW